MMKKSGLRWLSILIALAIALFFVISPSLSTADVAVTGSIMVVGHLLGPPVQVIRTPNVTYKATTFDWTVENGTLTDQYYNFTGLLRVHVNWNETSMTDFWNILELVNAANFHGNLTVEISQYAKIGSSYNDSYTSYLVVYMDHSWQTNASHGTLLKDNVSTAPMLLYPPNQVSYYFGVVYNDPFLSADPPPPLPPPGPGPLPQILQSGTPDHNALGEYVVFNFHIKFS